MSAKIGFRVQHSSQTDPFCLVQVELRERIAELEASRESEMEAIRVELSSAQRRAEDGSLNYQEQLKQHSVTICAMEERLNKVMKKNKDYQSEITTLRATVHGENVRVTH